MKGKDLLQAWIENISWKSLKIFGVLHSAPCWSTDTWWEATGRGRTESSLSPGRSRGRRSSGGWGGQRTSASSWRGCSQWWWTLARYRKSTLTQGGSVDCAYIFRRNNWKYLPVEVIVTKSMFVSQCTLLPKIVVTVLTLTLFRLWLFGVVKVRLCQLLI